MIVCQAATRRLYVCIFYCRSKHTFGLWTKFSARANYTRLPTPGDSTLAGTSRHLRHCVTRISPDVASLWQMGCQFTWYERCPVLEDVVLRLCTFSVRKVLKKFAVPSHFLARVVVSKQKGDAEMPPVSLETWGGNLWNPLVLIISKPYQTFPNGAYCSRPLLFGHVWAHVLCC